jgi:antitoxin HicB
MRYPVTITPDDGQFTVTFPDVPEAVTFGETREEALQRAPDALLTIFDAFMKDRRDIPAPSAGHGDAVELSALDTAKIALYRTMRERKVNKSELARRLHWHLPQVDRVLQVRHGSQLEQMEAAFAALGKRLVVDVEDDNRVGTLQVRLPATVIRRRTHTVRRATATARSRKTASLGRTGLRRAAVKKR